jgi:predicted DNA-binding transcriptional regulator AlpA
VWLTALDLAELLGVTDRCVWSWVKQGKIPRPVKRSRKWTRWHRDTINALMEKWRKESDAA